MAMREDEEEYMAALEILWELIEKAIKGGTIRNSPNHEDIKKFSDQIDVLDGLLERVSDNNDELR